MSASTQPQVRYIHTTAPHRPNHCTLHWANIMSSHKSQVPLLVLVEDPYSHRIRIWLVP